MTLQLPAGERQVAMICHQAVRHGLFGLTLCEPLNWSHRGGLGCHAKMACEHVEQC